MNNNSPLVSVIMSVFNGEYLLDKSIESILNQTFTDFEFIIIDDGSTDRTPDIIKKYETDKRVIAIPQENIGLTKSLNKAIKIARGELIARQDADDISLKERLLYLVNEFKKNPTLVLCGTRAVIRSGELCYESKMLDDNEILDKIYYYNPFIHSSVMFNKKKFIEIGMYDETYSTTQDYDAWLRLKKLGKIKIIDNVLVERVINDNSISKKKIIDNVLVERVINDNSISKKKLFQQCINSFKIRRIYISNYVNILMTLYQFISNSLPESLLKILKKNKS